VSTQIGVSQMAERKRCPKCGAINYGDVKKCWKCGEPFTPTAASSAVPPPPPKPSLEETLPQKTPRVKYPVLYPIGTGMLVVGVILSLLFIYLVTESPENLRENYDSENAVFAYNQKFPETVLGEVTAVSDSPDEYGYYRYELNGDGVIKEKVVSGSIQTTDENLIVRSKSSNLAKEGEKVIWEVDKRSNDVGQDYLVVVEEKSAALYRAPWFALAVVGIFLIILGYVGLPDRSMKELLEVAEAPAPPVPATPSPVAPAAAPPAPGAPQPSPTVPGGPPVGAAGPPPVPGAQPAAAPYPPQQPYPPPQTTPPPPEVYPQEETSPGETPAAEETEGSPESSGNEENTAPLPEAAEGEEIPPAEEGELLEGVVEEEEGKGSTQ